MLAVLVVAEWSYLGWGERVSHLRVKHIPFWCGEWIDLHAGPHFDSVVRYLRDLLDKAGLEISEDERKVVRSAFLEAVDCELAFFESAYAWAPEQPNSKEQGGSALKSEL